MKRSASLFGILALLVLVAPIASAQETRGSIEGVVKDSSGAVLPGATVEARAATGGIVSAVSDTLGTYRFPALTTGRYTVVANLTGFQPSKVEDVQLQLGQILKVNFALQIGGVSEAVQVTAESPLIDVKQNAASASIQKDVIDLIPKGRDFTSAVTTAPGTNHGSARRRHQHRRVERLREPLHRGRPGHDQRAERHVRQRHPARLRSGSPGQVERLQRGVPRGDGRGHQRHHAQRHERVPWRDRVVLHGQRLAPGRDPPGLAARSAQPAHRAVHDHRARPRPGRRADRHDRRPDPDRPALVFCRVQSRSSKTTSGPSPSPRTARPARRRFRTAGKITTSITTSRRSSRAACTRSSRAATIRPRDPSAFRGWSRTTFRARPVSSAIASRTPHSGRARPTRRISRACSTRINSTTGTRPPRTGS